MRTKTQKWHFSRWHVFYKGSVANPPLWWYLSEADCLWGQIFNFLVRILMTRIWDVQRDLILYFFCNDRTKWNLRNWLFVGKQRNKFWDLLAWVGSLLCFSVVVHRHRNPAALASTSSCISAGSSHLALIWKAMCSPLVVSGGHCTVLFFFHNIC